MSRWAAGVLVVDKRTIGVVALKSKQLFLAGLMAVRPSRRLRNVGKAGARLGVTYDIKGAGNPTALIRATGPWQLGVESPTKAHVIQPRGVGGSRAARSSTSALFDGKPFGSPSLLFNDGEHRHGVFHPGTTSAPKPWQKTKPIVKAKSVEWYRDAQRAEMARIFTGR